MFGVLPLHLQSQASAGLSEHCNSYDFHFDQVFGPQVSWPGGTAKRETSLESGSVGFSFRFSIDDSKS